MEINFRHGEALHLADQILVFKRTMREAALKHNVAATFMAKPMTGEPGSAMHLHQSVIDLNTGRNIFSSNDDGSMSQLFLHHVGGLQKYIPELLLCSRPTSIRSAAAGHLGAGERGMGQKNRTVGLRVPDSIRRTAVSRTAWQVPCEPLPGPSPQPAAATSAWSSSCRRASRSGPRLRAAQPAPAADPGSGAGGRMETCRELEKYLGGIHHRLRRGQARRAGELPPGDQLLGREFLMLSGVSKRRVGRPLPVHRLILARGD